MKPKPRPDLSMNLMRKLMGTGHNLTTSQSDPTLGIVHLKKMFEEFRTCSTSASQSAQEKKLYNMLPLFCRVGRSSSQERCYLLYQFLSAAL